MKKQGITWCGKTTQELHVEWYPAHESYTSTNASIASRTSILRAVITPSLVKQRVGTNSSYVFGGVVRNQLTAKKRALSYLYTSFLAQPQVV